jgi:hypothetical protein
VGNIVHNCVKDIAELNSPVAGDDASRKRPIPHESAVDVQVAVTQAVSRPQVTEAETSRFFQRNARRRWRLVDGNGEFCARETGEKFQRSIAMRSSEATPYDPKSRERWGEAALNPQPLTEEVVERERTNLRRDIASENPERRDTTLERIYQWLSVYMEKSPEERERLEREAHGATPEIGGE